MTDSVLGGPGRPNEPQCYNCGTFGHWAVACPEPTRQTPAGLAAWRSASTQGAVGAQDPRSSGKKYKDPIITKYAPPMQGRPAPPYYPPNHAIPHQPAPQHAATHLPSMPLPAYQTPNFPPRPVQYAPPYPPQHDPRHGPPSFPGHPLPQYPQPYTQPGPTLPQHVPPHYYTPYPQPQVYPSPGPESLHHGRLPPSQHSGPFQYGNPGMPPHPVALPQPHRFESHSPKRHEGRDRQQQNLRSASQGGNKNRRQGNRPEKRINNDMQLQKPQNSPRPTPRPVATGALNHPLPPKPPSLPAKPPPNRNDRHDRHDNRRDNKSKRKNDRRERHRDRERNMQQSKDGETSAKTQVVISSEQSPDLSFKDAAQPDSSPKSTSKAANEIQLSSNKPADTYTGQDLVAPDQELIKRSVETDSAETNPGYEVPLEETETAHLPRETASNENYVGHTKPIQGAAHRSEIESDPAFIQVHNPSTADALLKSAYRLSNTQEDATSRDDSRFPHRAHKRSRSASPSTGELGIKRRRPTSQSKSPGRDVTDSLWNSLGSPARITHQSTNRSRGNSRHSEDPPRGRSYRADSKRQHRNDSADSRVSSASGRSSDLDSLEAELLGVSSKGRSPGDLNGRDSENNRTPTAARQRPKPESAYSRRW